MAPRHARVDLRADHQLRDAQSLHTGARGLAARHHQLPNASLHQPAGDARQRLLDQGTGAVGAKLRLHLLQGGRAGRGIGQHRPSSEQWRSPGQGLCHDVVARSDLQRIDNKTSAALGKKCRHLGVGRRRATAGHDGAAPLGGRQSRGLRTGLEAMQRWQTDGQAGTRHHQRQIRRSASQVAQVVVAHGIDDGQTHALGAQCRNARNDGG